MYDGNLSRALRATKVGTRDEQCGNVGGTEGRLLKGIGSCACCGSRAAAAKARAAVTVARQIRARKHVSRRWPALPCRRHRHHFCCGTTAYAFAERRLAVVTGWVAIARFVPPTHRQSPDIPRNAGPIQLAAPPQSECIPSSRIAPRPSAFRRAATNRAPPLSNHEELRFDKGSRQRAHWAGPSPSSADELASSHVICGKAPQRHTGPELDT